MKPAGMVLVMITSVVVTGSLAATMRTHYVRVTVTTSQLLISVGPAMVTAVGRMVEADGRHPRGEWRGEIGSPRLDARRWMLVTQCWGLDAGISMLDGQYW